jgi:hypothetical protein
MLHDFFFTAYCTGAHARQYNIAASWAMLYCLAPGPRVSPHFLFSFKWAKAAAHTHTHTFSLIFTLSSFDLFIFCTLSLSFFLSFFLYPSVSGLPFENKKDVCSTKKKLENVTADAGIEPRMFS